MRNATLLTLALSSLALADTTKASACYEDGRAHVRLVDAEGKRHRYAVFPITKGTDLEWSDFEHSRKIVAMDSAAVLTVKQGTDERGESIFGKLGPLEECPATKRAAFPKL